MAIGTYINANDRFDQGAVLSLVGDADTAGGICRMLSVYWLIECTKAGAVGPEQSLHTMKSYGPVYFKQIGQAQKAYQTQYNAKLLGWFGSVRECLQLASKKTRGVVATSQWEQTASTAANFAPRIDLAIQQSTTHPPSCIISIVTPHGNHCIAAVQDLANQLHIFDPNYGVMIVPAAAHAQAIADIWNAYSVSLAVVAPAI